MNKKADGVSARTSNQPPKKPPGRRRPRRRDGEGGWRLVRCLVVRHWRTGLPMRRKDGKPFCFWVRDDGDFGEKPVRHPRRPRPDPTTF